MKKTLFILLLLSFLVLPSQKLKTEDLNNRFYLLNYTNEDIEYLNYLYSKEELNFIINKQIYKDNLFRYLSHQYFNLNDYLSYEQVKTKYQLTNFEAINLVNRPNLIKFDHTRQYKVNESLFQQSDLILVNKDYRLNESYNPPNLVLIDDLNAVLPGDLERNYINENAYLKLRQLFIEGLKQEIQLFVSNAYRSYYRQEQIYNQLILESEDNRMYSAMPGHSEHQTGLSVDVTCRDVDYQLDVAFENTKAGSFIIQNAYRYGFIIRYPKEKEHITGYHYEPWHLRYVGIDMATIMHNEQLTLEEYIFKYIPLDKA